MYGCTDLSDLRISVLGTPLLSVNSERCVMGSGKITLQSELRKCTELLCTSHYSLCS
jgi:hypothetical protein